MSVAPSLTPVLSTDAPTVADVITDSVSPMLSLVCGTLTCPAAAIVGLTTYPLPFIDIQLSDAGPLSDEDTYKTG